jgi:hypothetical protein
VKDPIVLQEDGIKRIGERELAQVATVQAEDRRDPAFDVLPVDQHDKHPIDAVAMQPLGRRLADLAGAGFYPELVQLHVSSFGPVRPRRQCVKYLPSDIEKTQGDRMDCDRLAHRPESTLDSAIERVVVPALIVRLVRLADDTFGRNGEGRETSAAIAPAVGHICVEAELVPLAAKEGHSASAGGVRNPRNSSAGAKLNPVDRIFSVMAKISLTGRAGRGSKLKQETASDTQ